MKTNVRNNFIEQFGLNLRKIRESKNVTMQNLADNINIEYSQISRIERGKINTSINTANEIAKYLEIELKELFDFSSPEKS